MCVPAPFFFLASVNAERVTASGLYNHSPVLSEPHWGSRGVTQCTVDLGLEVDTTIR